MCTRTYRSVAEGTGGSRWEVVVDEQPLAVGAAVSPEADDVPVPEPADEPHVAVEGLAPSGELQGVEPLHGRHDAVLEDRLVRAARRGHGRPGARAGKGRAATDATEVLAVMHTTCSTLFSGF